VQPQTPLLMRALQRLRVPTLLFVNKIDRRGASYDGVLRAIAERLTPAIVSLGDVRDPGTRGASFVAYTEDDGAFTAALADQLATTDDAILAAYVEGAGVQYERLCEELAAQTRDRKSTRLNSS